MHSTSRAALQKEDTIRASYCHFNRTTGTHALSLIRMRLSGLQRDVLSLYRKCLRESRKKPAGVRKHFEAFARAEFEKSIHMDKKDFAVIEYCLRKGQRQLENYSQPGIRDIIR